MHDECAFVMLPTEAVVINSTNMSIKLIDDERNILTKKPGVLYQAFLLN